VKKRQDAVGQKVFTCFGDNCCGGDRTCFCKNLGACLAPPLPGTDGFEVNALPDYVLPDNVAVHDICLNGKCETVFRSLIDLMNGDDYAGDYRFGVDAEWTFIKQGRWVKEVGPVACLIIANKDNVWLVAADACGKSLRSGHLRSFFEHDKVRLYGRNAGGDISKTNRNFNISITPKNVKEVGAMATEKHLGNQGNALQDLFSAAFGLHLPKPVDVRQSRWVYPWTEEQRRYAASDGHASWKLGDHLEDLPDPGRTLLKDPTNVPVAVGSDLAFVSAGKVLAIGKLVKLGTASKIKKHDGVNVSKTRAVVSVIKVFDLRATLKYTKVGGPVTLYDAVCTDVLWNMQNLRVATPAEVSRPPIVPSPPAPAPQPEEQIEDERPRPTWADLSAGVKKDIFHIMNLLKLPKDHSLYYRFYQEFRDTCLVNNTKDELDVREVLASVYGITDELEQTEWMKDSANEAYMRLRVRREVPRGDLLAQALEKLFAMFKDKVDDKMKKPRPFFSDDSKKKAKEIIEHARKGCLSDIPGVTLYFRVARDADGLSLWRCARGTNITELIHQKLHQLLSGTNLGPRAAVAVISLFRSRYNHRAAVRNRRGVPDFGHYNFALIERIQREVEQLVDMGVMDVADLEYPTWPNSDQFLPANEYVDVGPYTGSGGAEMTATEFTFDVDNDPRKKLSENKRFLAKRQESKCGLPFLPISAKERKLYNQLAAVPALLLDNGVVDSLAMCREWMTTGPDGRPKHVDGRDVFPKYPVMFDAYQKTHLKAQRRRNMEKGFAAELLALQTERAILFGSLDAEAGAYYQDVSDDETSDEEDGEHGRFRAKDRPPPPGLTYKDVIGVSVGVSEDADAAAARKKSAHMEMDMEMEMEMDFEPAEMSGNTGADEFDVGLAVSMIESAYFEQPQSSLRELAFAMYTADKQMILVYFLSESVLHEVMRALGKIVGTAVGDGDCLLWSALTLARSGSHNIPQASIPATPLLLREAVTTYIKTIFAPSGLPVNDNLFGEDGQLEQFSTPASRLAWANKYVVGGKYVGEEFAFAIGLFWKRNVNLWINVSVYSPGTKPTLMCLKFRYGNVEPGSLPLEFAFVNHNHYIPVFDKPAGSLFAALHRFAPALGVEDNVCARGVDAQPPQKKRKKESAPRRAARCMNKDHHGPPGSRNDCPGLKCTPKKCPWQQPREGFALPLPLPPRYRN
jgi:hypothetical protein